MRILGIIQARCSSSRFPGKVLKEILGKPMLELQIERILRSKMIEKLVVATSQEYSDDPIEELCGRIGIDCFRGSLNDVLDRYYQTAKRYCTDHIVRLTGDCPLADPELIDKVIKYYLDGDYDYAGNTIEPTYPDGLDVEVFTFSALEEAWKEATLPSEREHVTSFIDSRGSRYRLGSFKGDIDLSNLRWTVDEKEDFELIRTIYETLYTLNPAFTTKDVLNLIDARPELKGLNKMYTRNEGYAKSLADDEKHAQLKKLSKTMHMQERAKVRIPGMTQLLSKRPDKFSLGLWPSYFSRAKGVEVWDLDGNKYIDMSIGGIGANVLGYADPDVDEAVMKAIRMGTSSSLNCAEEVELGDLLCQIHPWAEMVRYARTGGEAMAIAVRIARTHTGRDKVAFCGYHGWHDWYLAANVGTENALGEHLISGLNPAGVPRNLAGTALPFRYNHIEELRDIVTKNRSDIAAIVMEPIRNDEPKDGFLERVREIATAIGAVFVVDEISAGFRLNTGGAHLTFGIEPDIAVFSKALGNGYPISAIIGRASVMDAAQKTFISSTNWTERIGPAAAIATINKHRRLNVGQHLTAVGRKVQEGWKRIADSNKVSIDVGGIPPMSHFSFMEKDDGVLEALYIQLMLKRGFLAATSFYAMYAHTENHIDQYLDATSEAFVKIRKAIEAGNAADMLIGKPAVAGFKRLI